MGFEGFRPTRTEKSDFDIPTIKELERIAQELENRKGDASPSLEVTSEEEGELPEAAALELRRVVQEVRKSS